MLYDYPSYAQNIGYYQGQGRQGYVHPDDPDYDSNDALNELGDIASEVSQKVRQKIHSGYTYLRDHPMLCEAAYFTAIFALKLALYLIISKGAENGYEGSL